MQTSAVSLSHTPAVTVEQCLLTDWLGRAVVWIQEFINCVVQKIIYCYSATLKYLHELKEDFFAPSWLDRDLKKTLKLPQQLQDIIAGFSIYEILRSVDGDINKFSPKFTEKFNEIAKGVTSFDPLLAVVSSRKGLDRQTIEDKLASFGTRKVEQLISLFPNLLTLDLSEISMPPHALRTISACCQKITALSVRPLHNYHYQMSYADIAEFAHLKKLKLNFNLFISNDGSLDGLRPLQDLEELVFDGNYAPVTDLTLQHLKLFPKLKKVTLLVGYDVKKPAFQNLIEHPTLEKVMLVLKREHHFSGAIRKSLEEARPNVKFIVKT